jgi:hypothetical protein
VVVYVKFTEWTIVKELMQKVRKEGDAKNVRRRGESQRFRSDVWERN